MHFVDHLNDWEVLYFQAVLAYLEASPGEVTLLSVLTSFSVTRCEEEKTCREVAVVLEEVWIAL